MSIRPPFASAIFEGRKLFEFRRAVFKRPVDVVVVYVTSPVAMVLGEFDVRGIISDRVDRLWRRTEAAAGIDRELFFAYFEGRASGHAIEVGDVRRYRHPLRLDEHFGLRPPQSFAYLDEAAS